MHMTMIGITTEQHHEAEVGVWACTICGEEVVGWCVPILCVPFLSVRVSCTGSGVVDSVDGKRIRWSHINSN